MTRHLDHLITPIDLFGNLDENFYQLGVRDRDHGKIVHESVKGMLKTPYVPLNRLIESIGKEVIKNTLLKNSSDYPHLVAYSDGMGIKVEELYYTMLIPELVSAMTKWAPGFVTGNLGCSSFFMRNEKGSVVHGRILDFPLQGSYDKYERIISYNLNGMPPTIGFNTAGIPYPSITAFTKDGMTIALHQKFTNIFNPKGESIFEIIFSLIKNVNDKKSAIEFLKSKKSLTTWCLYLSFKNGDILAYDLMGEESFYNELTINEKEVIYFCNHLENKVLDQKQFLPLGFNAYNCMRENSAHQKIVQFNKKNKYEDYELLKMMVSPKSINTKNQYEMDNITPTTILAVTMNPTEESLHIVSGSAPKVYQNNIEKIENVFSHSNTTRIEDNKYKNQNSDYQKGLHALMEAQKGFDDREPQIIYHHLQFAIDHLEKYPDHIIAKFYFLIAQYIYETHPKVLVHLLSEFTVIEKKLSGYLKEQCLLFIFRIEYILNQPITAEIDLITDIRLKDILQLEMKIPRRMFHLTNRLLIVPRIDILDVIYVYTH